MIVDTFSLAIMVFFIILSLAASFVNGALGYGFSSLAVPIALFIFPNKILNPAFVVVELLVNSIMLVYERAYFTKVISRTAPVIVSLLPGVLVGSYLLSIVHPDLVKIFLYVVLLPLILLQASGIRKPIKSELGFKLPFGLGLGLCYSLTTISGPPLALFWNNQGLAKNEFRASLAQVRFAETVTTGLAYLGLGLYNPVSTQLAGILLLPMIIGIPLGAYTINRVGVQTFRRICMSFDAWIVGYGLSRVVADMLLTAKDLAYSIFAATALIDAVLLYRFFFGKQGSNPIPVGALSDEARSLRDGRGRSSEEENVR